MVSVWGVCGVSVGCSWGTDGQKVRGLSMDSQLGVHEQFAGSQCVVHGYPGTLRAVFKEWRAWTVRGAFVDSLRTLRGQSVGVRGQSVDSPWIVHGQSWPVCGVVMGRCPWTVRGEFLDSPWTIRGQSVDGAVGNL